jgi:hypothetical protein
MSVPPAAAVAAAKAIAKEYTRLTFTPITAAATAS